MFCLVCPFGFSLDGDGFYYKIPDNLAGKLIVGQIVKIPFKKSLDLGVILKFVDKIPIDEKILREIDSIVFEKPLLTPENILLLEFISKKYYNLIHSVLGLFIPKNIQEKLEKGKFTLTSKKSYNYKSNVSKTLTEAQNNVLETIKNSTKNKFLLFGVTGSGKTEIYVRLIKDALDSGKTALLLVPEIILTNQISQYIGDVFGDDVLILTGQVLGAKRSRAFIDIYEQKAKIIVGTRSSLFYPYKNLGIIIVDEEHDESYISREKHRYDGVKIALKLADLHKTKVVLASGTPKVTHMYSALKGNLELINLLEEIGKIQ